MTEEGLEKGRERVDKGRAQGGNGVGREPIRRDGAGGLEFTDLHCYR